MSDCGADVVHDLNVLPYPFADNQFNEIHAYDVLEHCGRQGDWRFFFGQWSEFYRILKPGGVFCGICPGANTVWAWGDPGHTRVISEQSLLFLSQRVYASGVGNNAMSDYRSVWAGNFEAAHIQHQEDGRLTFMLVKVP